MKEQLAIYFQYTNGTIGNLIATLRNRLRGSAYWRDIIWQASGNGLAQAIGVLGMPLLTRLYTPHDFALQILFLQVVGFATGIMTWRYEYFIQLPKDDTDSEHLFQLVLSLGFIMLIISTPIMWIFRHSFSSWIGDAILAPWLAFAPITAVLSCYALALQHSVQRRKNFRQSGLSELAGKSAYIACGMMGSKFFEGATGLIAATALSAIGKIVWLSEIGKNWKSSTKHPIIKYEIFPNFSILGIQRLAITYARLSGAMVFSHLMATCTAALPSVFIAHEYSKETLGQFALVISTIYLPAGLIGTAIGQVYYQRAAEHWAKGENFAHIWRSTAKRLIIMGLPLYASAALISPWVYPLIFGKAWTNAGRYASLMAISAFFSFVNSPLDRTSMIVGVWWYLPFLQTIRVVTTGFAALIAGVNNWEFDTFLRIYVGQIILMYLIDYWAGWHFSSGRTSLRG